MMGTWDRVGRSLFVASAVGLAWGIRGDYGHVIGAMYPGAVLGLAWVLVAGSPGLLPLMPVIAGLTAAAIGAGGTMSYGILHGYAQADTPVNYSYGMGTLFLQGGCWGTFGCCLAGLLVDRRPMRTGDWLGLLVSVFLGGWAASALLVEVIGFQVNPPRNNISVAFLGGAIGQFAWLVGSGRSAGLRGAAYGFAGFGLGMAGGRLLANAAVHLETWGYTVNHWNVMEITCGFVGGGVFTYGMLGLGRVEPGETEPGEYRFPAILGAVFVLGVIPAWHRLARVPEKVAEWGKTLSELGYPDPAGLADQVLHGTDAVCAVAAGFAALWALFLARGWRWPAWLPVVVLSAVMLVFLDLTALYFWRPARPGYLNTQTGFWGLFAFMLVYLLFFYPRPLPAASSPTPSGLGRLVVAAVVAFGLIVALAGATNGDLTVPRANTRWPVWSWSEGPFPGR